MPTCQPKFQPKAESVGVVDLLAPAMASPFATFTGVTLPLSNVLVCRVSNLGALPKPCAPISVKLAAESRHRHRRVSSNEDKVGVGSPRKGCTCSKQR